jgi:uncharacterized protein (DUF433 family)
MRVTVAQIVNLVTNGMAVDDILREYPDLEPDDVGEALRYAASLANDEVRPLGPLGT